MQCDEEERVLLRVRVTEMLAAEASEADRKALQTMLRPIDGAGFTRPVAIGDYTDFYASIQHATNVGRLFRPDQPLLPNYKFVPVGYHGRASSIVISGTAVQRPCGQTKAPGAEVPVFGPSRQLDYELELAAYIGTGNSLGEPVEIDEAERHIFGYSILNDWSARDIQAWEYQPLGPFLSKSFATSVSPWVVTSEALEPYRTSLAQRGEGDPAPLAYLSAIDSSREAIEVQLEVYLSSQAMRDAGMPAMRVSSSNARGLYWSFAQMVTHHTSNGCNLRTGDLLASGTVSGTEERTRGCLLEMTQRGAAPLQLPTGEVRSFLEDGDEVTMRGFCEREGAPRIGWGECKGRVIPARLSSRE
jgi:fumarylacetoacetase